VVCNCVRSSRFSRFLSKITCALRHPDSGRYAARGFLLFATWTRGRRSQQKFDAMGRRLAPSPQGLDLKRKVNERRSAYRTRTVSDLHQELAAMTRAQSSDDGRRHIMEPLIEHLTLSPKRARLRALGRHAHRPAAPCCLGLPASAERRHAAARADRGGRGLRATVADSRRADDGART
jgi:hypothetical protein